MNDTETVRGYSGHAYFTVDQIAAMLPGPTRLMHEVGNRWWKVYYAAKAGNWALAAYETKEIYKLIDTCAITRPKFEKFMQPFLEHDLKAVQDAVKLESWTRFEAAYREATRNANDYHKAADKGVIQWKLPVFPPADMEMEPEEKLGG